MSKAEEKFIEELNKEHEIILGFQEYEKKIADLEAKLDEKKKEITNAYPFLKEYDNGVFTEYNVVYERDGIVATTCFGKNKEMAYEYLKTLRNDIKVVSQNQKAIEQLENVKEFCNQREKDFTYLRDDIKAISHNKWVDYIEELRFIKAHIDNQINELKEGK